MDGETKAQRSPVIYLARQREGGCGPRREGCPSQEAQGTENLAWLASLCHAGQIPQDDYRALGGMT